MLEGGYVFFARKWRCSGYKLGRAGWLQRSESRGMTAVGGGGSLVCTLVGCWGPGALFSAFPVPSMASRHTSEA